MPCRGAYRDYDSEDLTRAYNAVKDNVLSIRKASLTYSVPKSTLMDRLHGRISVDVVKSVTTPIFLQGILRQWQRLGTIIADKR